MAKGGARGALGASGGALGAFWGSVGELWGALGELWESSGSSGEALRGLSCFTGFFFSTGFPFQRNGEKVPQFYIYKLPINRLSGRYVSI